MSILFFAALVAQIVPLPAWASGRVAGPSALCVGAVLFVSGLLTDSMTGFVIGTALAGVGVGLVFGRGLGVTQNLADPERRADLIATYFLAAYVGTTVPTLVLGVLDQAVGPASSTLIVIGAIVALGIAGVVLARPSASAPSSTTRER